MTRRLISLLLFCLSSSVAFAKVKLECGAKELARQDCRLSSGTYDFRLLQKTVAWNDGTWPSVDPMPLNGEACAWEKIQFAFMDGHPILQFWLWDKGVGETQIESLHWYVAVAEKRKFTILSEGVMRKRRPEPAPDVPPPPPPTAPVKGKPASTPASAASSQPLAPVKPKFLYDPTEPHSLKAVKGGRLKWRLGSQKKTIELHQEK